MTVKELNQLRDLKREIRLDQRRLEELEAAACAIGGKGVSDMPHPTGHGDTLANHVAEIIDLQAIIAAKQQQCIYERNRLERYIAAIPDSLTRQIFTLRFVSGLSWHKTAMAIGGGNTDQSVKKRVYRYLKTEET